MKPVVAMLALVIAGTPLFAQQTGVIVGQPPGSAVGKRLPAVVVPPPKPTCESPGMDRVGGTAAPALPELVFSRMMDDLVCVRHSDGRSEKFLNGGPWMSLSPDGKDVAYWVPDKHELHVFSIAARADIVADTLPGTTMREIVWSSQGRVLAYFAGRANPPGIRIIDLDSGKRRILDATLTGIAGFPDAEHLTIVGFEGVQRINIASGRREVVAAIKYASQAEYSRSGMLLGVLASNINEAAIAKDDDEPDCTGGTFALFVRVATTGRVVKIPFPEGFDSVLDFDFSPDDHAVAVTFGAAACDYPGEVARVYVVSLPELALKPVSPEDRLSVKAHWSPDGKMIVYTDYTGSGAPLMAVDIKTGKAVKLTNPGQNGPDEFLGWR